MSVSKLIFGDIFDKVLNDVTIIRFCQRFHSVRSYEPVDLEMAKFARFSADEVRRPILAAC